MFTTLCTSICPMTMGAMPMDDMSMMSMDMEEDSHASSPCDHCDYDAEDVAYVAPSDEPIVAAELPTETFFAVLVQPNTIHIPLQGVPIANTGPPPISESLVGTVILRT
ncbi:MAG: hypothetical protein QF442_01260 [Candidatus Peribacteraceae bacterium]|nr:hypothetical protein [Candidatus Peribacteraceae bacterium]